MKALSEFNTLSEAQAYEAITGQLINRDSFNGWLGSAGIYKRMKAIAADDTHPFCDVMEAFLDSVDYKFIKGTTTGEQHIALLDSLIANEPTIGPQLAQIKPLVMARANVVNKPYEFKTQAEFDEAKDAGETLTLNGNAGQHTARINITTQPVKPFNIDIEHRYGPDAGNLTEWHTIGAFRGVDYTQRAYECNIPKSPAVYRELRAVSKVSVGMSIA